MDSMFRLVLTTSLYASIVGLVILIIKMILNNRISAAWHYLIWGILIVKLLVPFGPESTFSLFNLIPRVAVISDSKVMQEVPQKYENHAVNEIIKEQEIQAVHKSPVINSSQAQQQMEFEEESNKNVNYLGYIWAAGAVLILLWFLYTYYSLYRNLGKGLLPNDERLNNIFSACREKMRIRRGITLLLQDTVNTPSVWGAARPRILLSPSVLTLNSKQLEYILLHELAHYKRKDVLVNYLLLLLQAIHWFNPVIWYCFRRMRQDMEAAADEKVLGILEDKEYREYGRALLTVLESLNSPKFAPGLIGMVDNKKSLEKRIRLIKAADFFKGRRRVMFLAGLLSIILVGCVSLTNGTTKGKPPVKQAAYNAETLMKYKTPYVGDNSKVAGLIGSLPYSEFRGQISLQTESRPYGIAVNYDFSKVNTDTRNIESTFNRNAVILFALIDNVDFITFETGGTASSSQLKYTREEVQKSYNIDIREYAKSQKELEAFIRGLDFKIIIAPEKYTPAMSSFPGIKMIAEYFDSTGKILYSTEKSSLFTWDPSTGKMSKREKIIELSSNIPVYWSPDSSTEKAVVTVSLLDNQGEVVQKKEITILRDGSMFYSVQSSPDVIITKTSKTGSAQETEIGTPASDILGSKRIVPENGLPLGSARNAIITKLQSNGISIAAEKTNLSIEEITTEEAWRNMGVQLYRVKLDYALVDAVAVVKDEKCIAVLSGMPLSKGYLSDLNKDGIPEICVNTHFGSGIVDARVLIYDTNAQKEYTLSDRMKKDYYLRYEDGRLLVDIVPYNKDRDSVETTGTMILTKSGVSVGSIEVKKDIRLQD